MASGEDLRGVRVASIHAFRLRGGAFSCGHGCLRAAPPASEQAVSPAPALVARSAILAVAMTPHVFSAICTAIGGEAAVGAPSGPRALLPLRALLTCSLVGGAE